MTDTTKVTVSAEPLRQLLQALIGEPHYIRELQATMNPVLFPDNPINVLVAEYNAEVARVNAEEQKAGEETP